MDNGSNFFSTGSASQSLTAHEDLKSFAWDTTTTPFVLFASSDGGLHKTQDLAESWKLVSNGVRNIEFYSLTDSGTGFLGGTQDNGALSWTHRLTHVAVDFTGGDGGPVACQSEEHDVCYAIISAI
jgi:hypothetical protein